MEDLFSFVVIKYALYKLSLVFAGEQVGSGSTGEAHPAQRLQGQCHHQLYILLFCFADQRLIVGRPLGPYCVCVCACARACVCVCVCVCVCACVWAHLKLWSSSGVFKLNFPGKLNWPGPTPFPKFYVVLLLCPFRWVTSPFLWHTAQWKTLL